MEGQDIMKDRKGGLDRIGRGQKANGAGIGAGQEEKKVLTRTGDWTTHQGGLDAI